MRVCVCVLSLETFLATQKILMQVIMSFAEVNKSLIILCQYRGLNSEFTE